MPDQSEHMTICLFGEDGEVLASNVGHARMLSRQSDQIVGRNWREWTPGPQLAASEAAFARSLSGEPTEFLRRIVRPDGSVLFGQSHLFSTVRFNKPMVIGTMRLVHAGPANLPLDGAQDIAGYVNDLAKELAHMAAQSGLNRLSEKLSDVASDAGEIALALRAQSHLPN